MNNNKVTFIIAVNDELAFEECRFYINNLIVPQDFEIEIIPIRDATGLTTAYNSGMNSSDSKYKVYIHQDLFIINKNFISDILKIFSLDNIGIIGACGPKNIPENGVWWESPQIFGKVFESHSGKMQLLKFNEVEQEYEEVEGVDGLMIVTQYDVPWREDIFKGWHFYDLAQCMEFNKLGYKVVIPKQETPWCVHDCGIVNTMNGFYENRDIFINNYKSS
ncbi:MAG: glycosyltransferase family protein [Cetobacterium sp.]